MAWREHQQSAQYSPNTNVHPAFGNVHKIERNRRLTGSIMRLNYGMHSVRVGPLPIEKTDDPLGREPSLILQLARIEASIFGRDRNRIRPAAPGQVTWKYPYWQQERPPKRQPIGPFTMGSLPQQSIMQRISTAFQNMGQ